MLTKKTGPLVARFLLVPCLCLALPGCSLFLMDVSREVPDPSREPTCDGYFYPLVDLGLAVVFSGISAFLLVKGHKQGQKPCDEYLCGLEEMAEGVGFAIPAALHLISGTCGLVWAHECSKNREAYTAWLCLPPEEQQALVDEWRRRHLLTPLKKRREDGQEHTRKMPTDLVRPSSRLRKTVMIPAGGPAICSLEKGTHVLVRSVGESFHGVFIGCIGQEAEIERNNSVVRMTLDSIDEFRIVPGGGDHR